MKKILARGGIEFLAVLLGISGSLWVDDYRIELANQEKTIITLESLKKENLPEVLKSIKANSNKIKATRAITYVFDVIIIMAALLYFFDINFSKWLLLPAAASVTLHTRLAVLYELKCTLKQQEVILKYLKK